MPRLQRQQSHEHGRDEEASQRTNALLQRLSGREWTVIAGIDLKHGVEHVLVGPGGVFAISSRSPEGGGARVRDGVLWLRMGADARAVRPRVAINRQVLDTARMLHREIRSSTGREPPVHSVVVLWCEFPQGVAESSRIAFVCGRDLLAWLSSQPPALEESGRPEIVQAVHGMSSKGQYRRLRASNLGLRHRAA